MARCLTPLLLACLLVLPAGVAAGDDVPDVVARLEPSTVSVIAYEPERGKETQRYDIYGSGCFVSAAGHVLTADHVLDKVINPEGHVRRTSVVERLAVGWMADPATANATIVTNRDGANIEIVRRDGARDLALLRVHTERATPVTFLAAEAPGGSDVGLLGFPFGSALGFRPLFTRSAIAGSRHLPGRTEAVDHYRGYILDGIVYPGHSGSPVFDLRTGAVVGQVQRRIHETIPVAVTAGELIRFLRNAGVTPQVAGGASPPGGAAGDD